MAAFLLLQLVSLLQLAAALENQGIFRQNGSFDMQKLEDYEKNEKVEKEHVPPPSLTSLLNGLADQQAADTESQTLQAFCAFDLLQAVNFMARLAFATHNMQKNCPVATKEGYQAGAPASDARRACLAGVAVFFLSLSQIASGLVGAARTCTATLNVEAVCARPISTLITPIGNFINGGVFVASACAKSAQGLPKDIDRRLQERFAHMTEDRKWEIAECVDDATSTVMAIGQLALGLNNAVRRCPGKGIGKKKDLTTAQCTWDIGFALFSFSRIIMFLALASEHCTIGKQVESLCVAGIANLATGFTSVAYNGASIYANCVVGSEANATLQGLYLPKSIRKDVLKSKIWTQRRLQSSLDFSALRKEVMADVRNLPFKDSVELWASMGYNITDPNAPWLTDDAELPQEALAEETLPTSTESMLEVEVDFSKPPEPVAKEIPEEPLEPEAITETLACSEAGVLFEPLDMHGEAMTLEKNASHCQARCGRTPGCAHFSFWEPQGHCHLQDVLSIRRGDQALWRAGPPGCSPARISEATHRMLDRTGSCYHLHATYDKRDWIAPPQHVATVGRCQQLCQETPGCAFFAHSSFGECYFVGKDASRLDGVPFAMAGPRHCAAQIEKLFSNGPAPALVRASKSSAFVIASICAGVAAIILLALAFGRVRAVLQVQTRRAELQPMTASEGSPSSMFLL